MFLTFYIFLTTSYFILHKLYKISSKKSKLTGKKKLLVILGSGGHTQEMILMTQKLNFNKISHLYLVSSPCDKYSENKFIAHMTLYNINFQKIKSIIKIKIPRTNNPMGKIKCKTKKKIIK